MWALTFEGVKPWAEHQAGFNGHNAGRYVNASSAEHGRATLAARCRVENCDHDSRYPRI